MNTEELQEIKEKAERLAHYGDMSGSVLENIIYPIISTIEAQQKEIERLNSVNHTFALTIGELDKRIERLKEEKSSCERVMFRLEEEKQTAVKALEDIAETGYGIQQAKAQKALSQIQGKT